MHESVAPLARTLKENGNLLFRLNLEEMPKHGESQSFSSRDFSYLPSEGGNQSTIIFHNRNCIVHCDKGYLFDCPHLDINARSRELALEVIKEYVWEIGRLFGISVPGDLRLEHIQDWH